MNLLKLNKNNEYIHTLLKIQDYLPEAIIAGGAIRDLYHNKPIKDIDIYVPQDDGVAVHSVSFWRQVFDLNTMHGDYIDHSGTDGESYNGKNHIGVVWEIQKRGVLYNIIIVDVLPVEYVNDFFDIGLCKAYCDGKKIRLTADFMCDSQNKLLTVVSKHLPQEEFDGMMDNHVARLKTKYPSHTLVVPLKYKDFYNNYQQTLKIS